MIYSKTFHLDINAKIKALDLAAIPWFFNRADNPDVFTDW